ncbi:DUF2922 domain-containing protein [Peptoniphilus sp. AGMB00490]|uniref:DUF2922 domain-containing protein n=2 Tax=Peptoniphilus TaxID=162289 RepID=A0ACD6AZ98_9FIRM|nr:MULTISPECIES: DUF2922 family protein [Peptoniphilus]NMW85414.1 DUF2922 domain-containing protein [Peptoniphilus faecalis]OLR64764.1 hypothetical protein BIV18_04120 [Peptoniphilus porci]
MKSTNTLRIAFADEGGNPYNLSILNPKAEVTREEAKKVGDVITNNDLINGKQGFVKTFNGATMITRTERDL